MTVNVPSTQSKLPLFLLILVLMVGAGLAGYWLGRSPLNQISTPTPVATAIDETANWKTYTNSDYDFSFKYPSSATYKVTNYSGSKFSLTLNNLTDYQYTDLTVFVGNNWYFMNAEADTTRNFAVAGITAYREELPQGQNPPQTLIYIKRGADYITIQLVKDVGDTVIEKTFEKILATFKFL